MSDLNDMFAVVEGCCLHNPVFRPEDVDTEIVWHGDRSNGPESSSIVIVRLKPLPTQEYYQRDYGLFTQGEDYTGHGCQCSSMTVREPSLKALLEHLDDYDLEKLIRR